MRGPHTWSFVANVAWIFFTVGALATSFAGRPGRSVSKESTLKAKNLFLVSSELPSDKHN